MQEVVKKAPSAHSGCTSARKGIYEENDAANEQNKWEDSGREGGKRGRGEREGNDDVAVSYKIA